MAHPDREAVLRNDLSARDEFAVPQDVAFLNTANIGPRLAAVRADTHGFLFGVAPYDPLTFGAVVAVLALVALAACGIPARRAIRIPPSVALRS
jgi:hypothetical protein